MKWDQVMIALVGGVVLAGGAVAVGVLAKRAVSVEAVVAEVRAQVIEAPAGCCFNPETEKYRSLMPLLGEKEGYCVTPWVYTAPELCPELGTGEPTPTPTATRTPTPPPGQTPTPGPSPTPSATPTPTGTRTPTPTPTPPAYPWGPPTWVCRWNNISPEPVAAWIFAEAGLYGGEVWTPNGSRRLRPYEAVRWLPAGGMAVGAGVTSMQCSVVHVVGGREVFTEAPTERVWPVWRE